ncbi:uncharacterized protein LOC134262791 [Saccostrea cucullata]|uniref:uncharacterized protein LOC134262791 n=1 Tax=Saccostrea cuccullata TaxID=36930 RepID=UPI002ED0EC94
MEVSEAYNVSAVNISEKHERRGATKHCAYGLCKSDSRYMDRQGMEGVFFIRFPQFHREPEKCTRWANACRRENFTALSLQKFVRSRKRPLVRKNLTWSPEPKRKKSDLGNIDIAQTEAASATSTEDHPIAKLNLDTVQAAEALLMLQNSESEEVNIVSDGRKGLDIQDPNSMLKNSCDEETQTSSCCLTLNEFLALKLENFDLKSKIFELEKKSTQSKSFSIADVKDDDKKMIFYTGLTYGQFMCLWKFLGPATRNLSRINNMRKFELTPSKSRGPKRKLSPEDELFLTLVRLRLGLLHTDLAYRFGVSVSTVNEITSTWIQFLYLQFNRLRNAMFPSRKIISKHLPKSFRKYKKVRVILDATKFFTQVPRNYEQQGNLYSSYKNHCTCKVLIGITPSGAISFVSDVYEGSISDKEIFKKSKIMDKINPGDLVMVDRGFNVRDILLQKGADIVIPPFLGNRTNLSPQEEAQTRVIAKLRIHVERVIERIKKYKICKKIVPLNTLSTFSQTVFIVACLVNFQKPIVK